MNVEHVKVQRALFPADAPALIYAPRYDRLTHQPLDRRVLAALGDDLKGYFAAIWHGAEAEWELGVRLPDEDW